MKICPIGLKRIMQRVSQAAAVALFTVVSAVPLAAQTATQPPAQVAENETGLDLYVVDIQGAACVGSRVELAGEGKQTLAGTTSNAGELHWSHLSPGKYTLTVESQGFLPHKETLLFQAEKPSAVKVTLKVGTGVQSGPGVEPPLIPIVIEEPSVLLDPVPVPPLRAQASTHGRIRRLFDSVFHRSR